MCCLVVVLSLALLPCGCASRSDPERSGNPAGPLQCVINRLMATDCRARQLKPGATWIDYEHGGRRVRLDGDGVVRPIPASRKEGDPESSPLSGPAGGG
jgi:hypothetical protein